MEIIEHLYKNIDGTKPVQAPKDDIEYEKNGVLIKVNQSEVMSTEDTTKGNFDDAGWLYYPKHCVNGGCNLMVLMHGCGHRAMDMTTRELGWL